LARDYVCDNQKIGRTLKINIGAEGLMPREIRFFTNLLCKDGTYTYKIHLVKQMKPGEFNWVNLLRVEPLLSRQDADDADAALAFLGRAMDDLTQHDLNEPDKYTCYLKNYYQIALQQTCKFISYATCDEADSAAQQLGKSQICLRYLNKSQTYFLRAQADIRAKEAQIAIAQGNPDQAVEQWNQIQMISAHTGLESIGLTKDQIKTYQGLAYMKLGDSQLSSSQTDALHSYVLADKSLKSVKEPTELVKQHVAVLQAKISSNGQSSAF
jgi:hypothetical protein